MLKSNSHIGQATQLPVDMAFLPDVLTQHFVFTVQGFRSLFDCANVDLKRGGGLAPGISSGQDCLNISSRACHRGFHQSISRPEMDCRKYYDRSVRLLQKSRCINNIECNSLLSNMDEQPRRFPIPLIRCIKVFLQYVKPYNSVGATFSQFAKVTVEFISRGAPLEMRHFKGREAPHKFNMCDAHRSPPRFTTSGSKSYNKFIAYRRAYCLSNGLMRHA